MRKYPCPRIEKFTSLKEFLNSQLAELLPNQDTMIKNHLNLVEFLKRESPLFVLRKFKNHNSRGSLYAFENHSFTVSDNEPALWVFMETYYQSELDFQDLIENQRFPIAFAIKREEKQENKWKTIGRKHKDFSENGWKHCHIFQCSPNGEQIADINILKSRSLRLLSPLNHFPFFSPRKYAMPFDYGEDEKCIKYVIWWLYNRFYTDKNKPFFKAFIKEQNFIIPTEEPKDIKIEYSIKKMNNGVAEFAKNNTTERIEVMNPTNNHIQNNLDITHFKISKNWYGQGKVITVRFKNGRMYQYNHDKVYDNTILHFRNLPCWKKYGWYSNSKNIPGNAEHFVTEIF